MKKCFFKLIIITLLFCLDSGFIFSNKDGSLIPIDHLYKHINGKFFEKNHYLFSIGYTLETNDWLILHADLSYNMNFLTISSFYRFINKKYENDNHVQVTENYPYIRNNIFGIGIGENFTNGYFYSNITAGIGYEKGIKSAELINSATKGSNEKITFGNICYRLKFNFGFRLLPFVTYIACDAILAENFKPVYLFSANLGIIMF